VGWSRKRDQQKKPVINRRKSIPRALICPGFFVLMIPSTGTIALAATNPLVRLAFCTPGNQLCGGTVFLRTIRLALPGMP